MSKIPSTTAKYWTSNWTQLGFHGRSENQFVFLQCNELFFTMLLFDVQQPVNES